MEQLLFMLFGAVLAVGAQLAFERSRDAHRAKVVALAVEAELHGVEFTGNTFGGFSAIAFDMMLPQIATRRNSDRPRRLIRDR